MYTYNPIGDIIVAALCVTLGILLIHTFRNNHGVRLTTGMLVALWISSGSGIAFHALAESNSPDPVLVYPLRFIHYTALSLSLFMYILYMREPLWIPKAKIRRHKTGTLTVLGVTCVYIENSQIHQGINLYIILYWLLMIQVFSMFIIRRSRIIKPVFRGLMAVNSVSVLISFIQIVFRQISFTAIMYFIPLLGIIFVFHSNPFKIDSGLVSDDYFYSDLDKNLDSKRSVLMISCSLMDFSKALSKSKQLEDDFFCFLRKNVRHGIIYQFPGDRFILAINEHSDRNYEKSIQKLIDSFMEMYEQYKIDYKITVLETTPEIAHASEYVKLIDFIENTSPYNVVHRVNGDDIKRFCSSSYILSQLEDIIKKKDLNDERVLVYCQPVYNILTGAYDTAEALMRINLPEMGMIYPDVFIPLAEQFNMVHTLSLIILNKTCVEVRNLISQGYQFSRISVNFSVIDIRYDTFCSEVQQIVENNHIPYDKIAIEITESRCETDFNMMKTRITQLQQLGMKFYLDDFGTGYSNFERIMELPFDIIKFDRSMLVESAKNDSSRYMVSAFAGVFSQLDYAVLFEGVEDDNDEKHCIDMNAKYLQGYKYSKPIPIEQLRDFLRTESSLGEPVSIGCDE